MDFLLYFALIGSSCSATTAIVQLSIHNFIKQEELEKILPIPQKMNGLVATLFESPDLRVFGVVDRTGKFLDSLEIWGFGNNPMRLARIMVDPPEGAFHTNEVVYPAGLFLALDAHPKLQRLLTHRGIVRAMSIADKMTLDQTIEAQSKTAEKKYKNWDEVFEVIYRDAYRDQLSIESLGNILENGKKVPAALRTGAKFPSIRFAGWLQNKKLSDADQTKAMAALHFFPKGSGLGYEIYLNPVYKTKEFYGAEFVALQDRIRLEGRFLLEWLNISKPVIIELEHFDGKDDSTNSTILIFKSKEDIPPGVKFNFLDPLTGMSEGPITEMATKTDE